MVVTQERAEGTKLGTQEGKSPLEAAPSLEEEKSHR